MHLKTNFILIHLIVFLTGIVLLLSCNKSEKEIPQLILPEEVVVLEGTQTQNKAIIVVGLSSAYDQNVVLKYSLVDGTALAGDDYVSQTDIELVFLPGETSKNIEIDILNDDVFEEDEYFSLVVLSIKNARLVQSQCRVIIENDDFFAPEIIVPERKMIAEGNTNTIQTSFTVRLSGPSEGTVSLKWSTADGSGKGSEDYIPANDQSVVFNPGETEKQITVDIISDLVFEMDDIFYVQYSDVQNGTINFNQTSIIILNDDSFSPELTDDGYITPISYPGMQLTWSDEFDGTAINTSNWGYDTGAGGWGNSELQTYTTSSQNSYVEDGKLNIVAIEQINAYSSARLLSKGKKEFTYGRIDIRAKLPYGQGIWPALWTLGANLSQVGWPKCGEIDILEYLGHQESKAHGTIHYYDNGHRYIGGVYTLSNNQSFHDLFHVFTIVWQENAIRWYVDYQLYYEVKDTNIKYDAFKLPQFFIMNVAVGGVWPGYPDATTVFPQRMIVDYVRVFQTP